jgi:hypothetical protein
MQLALREPAESANTVGKSPVEGEAKRTDGHGGRLEKCSSLNNNEIVLYGDCDRGRRDLKEIQLLIRSGLNSGFPLNPCETDFR